MHCRLSRLQTSKLPTDSNGNNVYVVTVQASDGQGGTAFQNISVNVTNVNEQNQHAPVFTSPSALTVPENTTFLINVTAIDADLPPQAVTFSVVGGADQARFSITGGGALSFVSPPDFELPTDSNGNNVYVVTVRASDGQGGTAFQNISVNVTNVNEQNQHAPVFTSPSALTVPENTTFLINVTAIDADLPPQAVTFSVVGGADQARFSITGGGALSFVSPPDFELPTDSNGNNVYVVTVRASDGQGGTAFQTITVTVTNASEGLVITSPNVAFVPENTTAVLTVTATGGGGIPQTGLITVDAGVPTPGMPGFITYTVSATADAPITAIDFVGDGSNNPATGRGFFGPLNQVNPFGLPTIFNDNNVFFASIGSNPARDSQFSVSSSSVVVPPGLTEEGSNILQAAWAWTAPQANSIAFAQLVVPGSAGSVQFRGAITVLRNGVQTDIPVQGVLGQQQAVGFSIVGGPDQSRFTITPGGALSFVTPPNFEAPTDTNGDNVYVVTVQANDGRGNTATQTIFVNVTNVNEQNQHAPVFTSPSALTVPENTTSLLTVTATDADLPPQAVTFSIIGGIDHPQFAITPGGQLSFRAPADFENPTDVGRDNVYVVNVQASDGNGGTSVQQIVVTVTNVNEQDQHAPVFTSPSALTVPENTTFLINVTATDADLPPQAVTFSIVGGIDHPQFTITPGGQLSFRAPADFENPTDIGRDNVYIVNVQASDSTGRTSLQQITVTVTNVNEGLVITSPNVAFVPENTTAVMTVTATGGGGIPQTGLITVDAGVPTPGMPGFITYTVSATADAPITAIDFVGDGSNNPATGRGFFGPLNQVNPFGLPTIFNDNNVFFASIGSNPARDSQFNVSSSTVVVPPGLTEEGSNILQAAWAWTAPQANSIAFAQLVVPGSAGSVQFRGAITVLRNGVQTDIPVQGVLGQQQAVGFSIVGGPDQSRFTITPGGALSFVTPPNFEAPTDTNGDNVYVVTVQANDGRGNTATQTISVNVTPVNEHAPVFTSPSALTVPENTTSLLTVTATDADLPPQAVTFSIFGGVDHPQFSITPGGQLSFRAPADFENPTDIGRDNVYVVNLQASDGNGRTSLQQVVVTVTPVNEHAPVFTSPSTLSVPENTTFVLNVTATDPDLPQQAVTFSIVGGIDHPQFTITSTGQLSFRAPADFEAPTDVGRDNVYVVNVQASDGTFASLQQIVVTVTNLLEAFAGDYNRNGIVDTADYVVWRNTLGQTVPPLSGADGSGNGLVGFEDYNIWQSNFGRTSGRAA